MSGAASFLQFVTINGLSRANLLKAKWGGGGGGIFKFKKKKKKKFKGEVLQSFQNHFHRNSILRELFSKCALVYQTQLQVPPKFISTSAAFLWCSSPVFLRHRFTVRHYRMTVLDLISCWGNRQTFTSQSDSVLCLTRIQQVLFSSRQRAPIANEIAHYIWHTPPW